MGGNGVAILANNFCASNLHQLQVDIRRAERYSTAISLPAIPPTKEALRGRIQQLECNLVAEYTPSFWDPAKKYLFERPSRDFKPLSLPMKERVVYFEDQGYSNKSAYKKADQLERAHVIALLLLEKSSNYESEKMKALQQINCDMWNTFVAGATCPTPNCLPPVTVLNDDDGPWALDRHEISTLKIDAVPIISMPKGYINRGVLGLTILGHESVHAFLSPEALKALGKAMLNDLNHHRKSIRDYWAQRVSETAADVGGVLFMGPTAAIGLIASLRACSRTLQLSNEMDYADPDSQDGDPHPADILRGLVVAYTVLHLDITTVSKKSWAIDLLKEVKKDFDKDQLGLSWEKANEYCKEVAESIIYTKIVDGRSLKEIRCWNQTDEAAANSYSLEHCYLTPPTLVNAPTYSAPHILAGANLYLLSYNCNLGSEPQKIQRVFNEMIASLIKESTRQGVLCKTCPLTQKIDYLDCSACGDTLNNDTKDKNNSNLGDENNSNTGLYVGLGIVGILAIAVIGVGIYCHSNPGKGKNNNGTPARAQ